MRNSAEKLVGVVALTTLREALLIELLGALPHRHSSETRLLTAIALVGPIQLLETQFHSLGRGTAARGERQDPDPYEQSTHECTEPGSRGRPTDKRVPAEE